MSARDVVSEVLKRYLKRSRWAQEIREDLEQEGRLAVLKARETFNPEKGDWEGYAYQAAWKAVATYLVADSSPVTCKRKGAPNTARRAAVGEVDGMQAEKPFDLGVWRERVRARLSAVVESPPLEATLLGEHPPRVFAAQQGIEVERAYRMVAAARRAAAEDSELSALMDVLDGVQQDP